MGADLEAHRGACRLRRMGPFIAGLAAIVLAAGLFYVIGPGPQGPFGRPAGISDAEVVDAVTTWLEQCATATDAEPVNCPQAAEDHVSSRVGPFLWRTADPLLDSPTVAWDGGDGEFDVDAYFTMEVVHDLVPASGAPRQVVGRLYAPMSAGLRPNAAAPVYRMSWDGRGSAVGDFRVIEFGPKRAWVCC